MMISVLVSKFDLVFDKVKDELENVVRPDMKVAILPWAFPIEIDAETLDKEYFPKNGRRYNKYALGLYELGIKDENIVVCNCYSHSKDELKDIIRNADILVLPGGNPEMFFSKVVHDTELLYDIKYFKGIIIGESAGCELQLKRYFITAKNNYYKYFAFYDGFGVLDDPFYMDVHTTNNKHYLEKLQKVSDETRKKVYAIYDDGAIIYNRDNYKLKIFGNVKEIFPKNKI